ncbi:MAG: hypothetical protein M3041_04600 [Acidobacteriota bacterium]|nr:hypothetical protein [Acidobacteriota bacterium]
MPAWLKIVLIVIGVFVLIIIGFGIVGYVYFNQHKEEWIKAGAAAKQDGEAFAAGKDGAQCVDEGLKRLGACSGLSCEITVRAFVQSCMAKAAPAPQLCTNVPRRSEIISSAKWAIDECSHRGLAGSQPCGRLLQEVQRYCERR